MMRMVWSVLVVLVLLAPFGSVGITEAPIDAEILAAPRGPAGARATSRILQLPPPIMIGSTVVVLPPAVAASTPASAPPVAIVPSDRHPSGSPRDPPV